MILYQGEYGFDNTQPQPYLFSITDDYNEKAFYDAVVHKYYFTSIGFDSLEQFIYRFNAIYKDNIYHYLKLYSLQAKVGLAGSYKSGRDSSLHSGSDSDEVTENEQKRLEGSAHTTYTKGVTTISEQTTGNQGSKQTRTSQNEELIVEGSSKTEVTDSGSDTDNVITTDVHTNTKNDNKTKTYNSKFENDNDEVIKLLSRDDYKSLQDTNIIEQFTRLFDKLFLEVFI